MFEQSGIRKVAYTEGGIDTYPLANPHGDCPDLIMRAGYQTMGSRVSVAG